MTAAADGAPGAARHRVVIIGAGFGGLFAARALRWAPVEVTVVDRTNHHLFQPLLYQVATGVLSEGDIAPPIREVLRNQRNARVLLGEVVQLAEVAMQSGVHAAHTIAHRLGGDTGQRPFRYRDLGTMATIARFRAVVFVGRVHVTGFAAWLMWLIVHLAFLTGFKNRLAAVANWAVAFLGHGRRQRTITEQQVFARTREVQPPKAAAPDRAFFERPSGRDNTTSHAS